MLESIRSFSSFSVDNLEKAKEFYGETLGIRVQEEGDMGLKLHLSGDSIIFVYPKSNHQPATFTVLNFIVDNIDETVESMNSRGIRFIQYGIEQIPQDEKGVHRGLSLGKGPDIAWFEDPSGNILSVLQDKPG